MLFSSSTDDSICSFVYGISVLVQSDGIELHVLPGFRIIETIGSDFKERGFGFARFVFADQEFLADGLERRGQITLFEIAFDSFFIHQVLPHGRTRGCVGENETIIESKEIVVEIAKS